MDGAGTLLPNILIVEDEPALVELLTYNLEKAGFRTAVARDGEEAMLAVAEAKPDLVLLDWMLPYVSGIEICRRLRRDPETRDLPVILLTARGEEGDRIRGLESGADDYVVKPFSPSELIARVRAVMRRTRPAFDKDTLTYAVPDGLDTLVPGMRVMVPLGRRLVMGFVIRTHGSMPDFAVKAVQQVLDAEPVITPEVQTLCDWVHRYYPC